MESMSCLLFVQMEALRGYLTLASAAGLRDDAGKLLDNRRERTGSEGRSDAMSSKFSPLPPDLVQLHPGLGVLRLAALFAGGQGELDEESLDAMYVLMQAGVLEDTPPADMWPELARGLMGSAPSQMIVALRDCGALQVVLPELAGLFGVPQLAENSETVDLGLHLLETLTEAAICDAPLAVRFALLVMNVGKTDSPEEHLPVHYRHVERGRPRIEAICDRFCLPRTYRELALLALAECERVERVSEIRAGPIARMLERLRAFDDRECFERLMQVCLCDWRGYGNRSGQAYPKAALLEKALRACAEVEDELTPEELTSANALETLRAARAVVIAEAFRSVRWSE
jgi:tRNA nucleotidyltransferase (CCA-adding enzyme)